MPKNRDLQNRLFAHVLGERMRAARQAKKLSAAAVAAQLGKTQQMVTKYELGLTVPYVDVLADYASIVGVTVGHLLGEDSNGRNDRRARPVRYRG